MVIDKDNIKIFLIMLVVGLGIGYAYINSDLNINGTAQVNHANWDVHWANIQVTNGSVSGANVVTQPTISNSTTVNYSIILSKPGDYYEFTVDAVKGGAIDAMIDTISSKLNGTEITTLPAYLKYKVTYGSGAQLLENHRLLANITETYKVRLEYRTDINENQLPTSNQTLSLQFTVTYRQANENAIEVDHSIITYISNEYEENPPYYNSNCIGYPIMSTSPQYETVEEAIAAVRLATNLNNIWYTFKHRIENGVITDSYIVFVIPTSIASTNPSLTAGTYELRGINVYDPVTDQCRSEYYNSTTGVCLSPYYEENKATVFSAFGNSICRDEGYGTYCNIDNYMIGVQAGGGIYIVNNIGSCPDLWDCSISEGGTTSCNYMPASPYCSPEVG